MDLSSLLGPPKDHSPQSSTNRTTDLQTWDYVKATCQRPGTLDIRPTFVPETYKLRPLTESTITFEPWTRTKVARESLLALRSASPASPTSWVSKPADKRVVGYLSLPGEIRNQIMELALVVGAIHLTKPEVLYGRVMNTQSYSRDYERFYTTRQPGTASDGLVWGSLVQETSRWSPSDLQRIAIAEEARENRGWCGKRSRPCWALLSTCKQIYREAYHLPYVGNCFVLPPGSLKNLFYRMDQLRIRDNLSLIHSYCVEISFADLDADALSYIKERYSHDHDRNSITFAPKRMVIKYLLHALRNTWASKLAYVREIAEQGRISNCMVYFKLPDSERHRKLWEDGGYSCDLLSVGGLSIPDFFRGIAPTDHLPRLNRRGIYDTFQDEIDSDWSSSMTWWFLSFLLRVSCVLRKHLPKYGLLGFDPRALGLTGEKCDEYFRARKCIRKTVCDYPFEYSGSIDRVDRCLMGHES